MLTTSRPPLRTCIGCRGKANKAELLRVVWSGTEVVSDPMARRPGRGAYLHYSAACLESATRSRAFQRALRVAGDVDTDEVRIALSHHPPVAEGAQDEHPMNGRS